MGDAPTDVRPVEALRCAQNVSASITVVRPVRQGRPASERRLVARSRVAAWPDELIVRAMPRRNARALAFGFLPLFMVGCGSPSPPSAPASVDLPIGKGASTRTACVDPKLDPATERERGIDALLGDRAQEAIELLDAALKKNPNDHAAEAFRRGAAAKLEESRASASAAPAPRVALQPIPLVRTQVRAVDGVPSRKVHLEKESEKKNAITDTAEWAAKNELRPVVHHGLSKELPPHVAPALGKQRLETAFVHADHAVGVYGDTMLITSEGRGSAAFDLTSALTRAARPFEVMFAQLVGTTLVVELAYNGYARDSGGKNGYLAAYDAKTGELLWVSDPLTGNAREALVSGGSIVTGYGFTAEPDFVFVLDLATGKAEQKIPVKSGPELMRLKGDLLFVRTYDTDYVFKSTTGFPPALPPAFPNGPALAASAAPPIDAETRCWVRRATSSMLASDAAGIHEAAERLKPLSRDRTLDSVLRDAEQKADAR